MKTAEWVERWRRERYAVNRQFSENWEWSDGEQWVTDRNGASEESEDVITKSRMWFWLWVGKFTCWVKLNDDKIERNWEVVWSEWLSKWMLKSPTWWKPWKQTTKAYRLDHMCNAQHATYEPTTSQRLITRYTLFSVILSFRSRNREDCTAGSIPGTFIVSSINSVQEGPISRVSSA